MKYPLFLCDFDGTLVRRDGSISENNKEAIRRYEEAGGRFVVVTGRMLTSILPRVREFQKRGLVVAYQGATIADIATGKLLRDECFPKEDALAAVRFLEREGAHIHVYTSDAFYSNRDDALLRRYELTCGVKGVVTEELSSLAEELRVVKVLAMTDPSERDVLLSRAEEALPKLFVTTSSDVLVEIMPKGQSKAAAVYALSSLLQIPTERIAAIGDERNDCPMIEAAGGRFSVRNAAPSLKNKSIVVPSCEEDGVAYALYHYAMGEQL